ncbi:hypothetical protein [Magnetospirillum sp. ME-1]|uniref:hypothetical protein n=1 Tax=Magnetospirillum sp. ME-1 TaxID=1639348 RepID=UPI0011AE5BC7|nr:hypothetical protein [Magnetospirillum sp. ME-1]
MAEVDNSALFQLLGSVAADVREMKTDMRGMKSDMQQVKTTLSEHDYRFGELRQALTEYHSSVLGHGVLISEMEDRIRRIERHLGLPPAAAE